MKKFVLLAAVLGGAILVARPLMAQETTAAKPLAQQKTFRVAIDAGRGGVDKGDVAGGVAAKDVNLILARKLKAELEARGIQAVMTRTDDRYVTLHDRTDLVKSSGADFLVSLSSRESSKNSPYYGVEYQRQASPAFANSLSASLGNFARRAGGGVRQTAVNYFVLREVPVPAAMVSGDLAKLSDSYAQDRLVNATVRGIAQFAKSSQQ